MTTTRATDRWMRCSSRKRKTSGCETDICFIASGHTDNIYTEAAPDRNRLICAISRVRKRQRRDVCMHARQSLLLYDEQREREMRSISSLLTRAVSRVRKRQRRDVCMHARQSLLLYDEQRKSVYCRGVLLDKFAWGGGKMEGDELATVRRLPMTI